MEMFNSPNKNINPDKQFSLEEINSTNSIKDTQKGIFNLSEKKILNQLMRIKNASGAALIKTLYKKVRNIKPDCYEESNCSDKNDTMVNSTKPRINEVYLQNQSQKKEWEQNGQ